MLIHLANNKRASNDSQNEDNSQLTSELLVVMMEHEITKPQQEIIISRPIAASQKQIDYSLHLEKILFCKLFELLPCDMDGGGVGLECLLLILQNLIIFGVKRSIVSIVRFLFIFKRGTQSPVNEDADCHLEGDEDEQDQLPLKILLFSND